MVQAFLHTKSRPNKPLGKRKRARRRPYAKTWDINSAGRGPVQPDLAPMNTKTHFAFRVDVWDDTGNSIVENVAGVDDFEVAEATYRAAVSRWPAARKLCDRASGWCMLRRCTGMGAKPRAPRLAGLGFVMVPLVCRRRQ